jgi:hypothetical protein
MIKVALISGGRESTAMVKKVEDKFGKDFFDEKMFANTGDDPHGVATIEHLEKYCGWKVTTVKSKHFPIVKYYEDAHVIDKLDVKDSGHAMPFHAQKDCSTKFKITPVRNYLREKYGKKEKFEIYYGFSFSKKEVERKMRVTKPEYQVGYATYKFPLIDMKIDRKLCGDICKELMGFIPEPSLCDMCFERTQGEWKKFYKDNPVRAEEVMKFEESSHIFKVFGYGLNGVPLRKLFGLEPLDKEQKKLFDTYTPEKINAIMDTEILTKKISVGCNCMEDVRIFDKVDIDE